MSSFWDEMLEYPGFLFPDDPFEDPEDPNVMVWLQPGSWIIAVGAPAFLKSGDVTVFFADQRVDHV